MDHSARWVGIAALLVPGLIAAGAMLVALVTGAIWLAATAGWMDFDYGPTSLSSVGAIATVNLLGSAAAAWLTHHLYGIVRQPGRERRAADDPVALMATMNALRAPRNATPERPARRDDWKTEPLPDGWVTLPVDRVYTDAEFERIRMGFRPRQMEDHWFIYYDEPRLYAHRSWTGYCVYEITFAHDSDGHRVAEVRANRCAEQYSETDDGQDTLLVCHLLDATAGRAQQAADLLMRYIKTDRAPASS
ncbi:MAG: hypothetical protein GC159_21610 [Phycisphaera sp.]|nr:hypothetical protein [Phycisphaera sp.]